MAKGEPIAAAERVDALRQQAWPLVNVAFDAAVAANPRLMEALPMDALREAFMVGILAIQSASAESCPAGAHCCCCGPGEPCCDCGMIMPAEPGTYLIWSNEHRAWWRADECGYTTHQEGAGHYARARAIEIAARARDGWRPGEPPPEIAVLAADVLEQAARAQE